LNNILLANYQTCIPGHNGLDATRLADRGINDRLIKRHSLID